MPSVAVTPLQLTLTGGAVATTPARITAGRLSLHLGMGNVTAGPGTGTALSVTAPTLNKLYGPEQLTNPNGTPTRRLMGIWQEAMDKIEEAFAALSQQVADNTTLLNQIAAAQALAQAANDNAETVNSRTSLADSYTNPASVGTYDNTGAVTIAAHSRVYGDGTSVAVDGGSVSGFTAGQYVTVYYVDAGREGGAVTYQGTTNAIAQTGDVHIVARGTIPAAGNPPAEGSSPSAPGYTPPSSGGGTYDPDYIEP